MRMRSTIFRLHEWSFWHYQVFGWTIFIATHMAVSISRYGLKWNALTSIFLQLIAGFFISLVLRWYYRTVPFQTIGLAHLVFRIGVASFLAAVVFFYGWFFIEWAIFGKKLLLYASKPLRSAQIIAISFPDKVAWSALYFGIKLWREWSVQRELANSATETAHAAQLQILRYQLNPQFLFNALNTVRSLIDEDSRSAKRVITDLSEFLRYSLVNREQLTVTLREEFAAIRLYLSIEQQRMESRLHVSLTISPETEQMTLPGFSIHPLVEYALRNAFTDSSGPVTMSIRAERTNGALTVTVSRINIDSPGHAAAPESEERMVAWTKLAARLSNAFDGKATVGQSRSNGTLNYILSIHQTPGEEHGDEDPRLDR